MMPRAILNTCACGAGQWCVVRVVCMHTAPTAARYEVCAADHTGRRNTIAPACGLVAAATTAPALRNGGG